MVRVLSRVRVVRSEERRMESLADPSRWGGLDENDPASIACWMKKMGREMGEDISDEEIDEMIDGAMDETEGGKGGAKGDSPDAEAEE